MIEPSELHKLVRPEWRWLLDLLEEADPEAVYEGINTDPLARPRRKTILTAYLTDPCDHNRSVVIWSRMSWTNKLTFRGWTPCYIIFDVSDPEAKMSFLHELGHLAASYLGQADFSDSGTVRNEMSAWRGVVTIMKPGAIPEAEIMNDFRDSLGGYFRLNGLDRRKLKRLKRIEPFRINSKQEIIC